MFVFVFKQKTAYEMRISDWSSDVCSSDLSTAPFSPLSAARSVGPGNTPRRPRPILQHIFYGYLFLENSVDIFGPARDCERKLDNQRLRSEERRVGKECGSTCRSRWSPFH